MKILSVVGARPQFVKLAPVGRAVTDRGLLHVVVHTGQHYDGHMSQSFFDELDMPPADVNLNVGSGTHGVQTGQMLMSLENVLAAEAPDWVLVYGDTNSTLAAAICATKLHFPLAHLEAGLRSFNRRMPEEHNRVLTDHSADLCLAPTEVAMTHLAREGLAERSVLVGDVMTDVLLTTAAAVARAPVLSPVPRDPAGVLATIHRPDNTDDPERLDAILDSLAALDCPVYLPAHPRLVSKAAAQGIKLERGSIRPVPPLSYPQLVQAVRAARAVVTDSGGLQKEAYLLGTPTTTVRSETEWVETLAGGWNVLVDSPSQIGVAVERSAPTCDRGTPYGDGHAAARVVDALTSRLTLEAL